MAEWRNLGLDFVTLRVFKAAVEERSLVSAAEREHLAPSAISRRISDFEARLGITLLRRHDRGVEPTAAGQLLMRHVEALFNIVDMTMADLESLSLGQTGSVKILANLSTISGQMPNLLGQLASQHPSIDFHLEQSDSEEAVRAVGLGLADIALVTGSVDVSHLTSFEFSVDRLVVVLPQKQPWVELGSHLKLRDIVCQPYIGLHNDLALQTLIRQKAAGLGCSLREVVNVGGFETIGNFVGRGLGLSVMPERHARAIHDQEKVLISELNEDWAIRRTQVCVKSIASLSPAAKVVLDRILDSRM